MNKHFYYKLRDTEDEEYNEILTTEDECKEVLDFAVGLWYDRDCIDFENDTEEILQDFCNCFDKSKITEVEYTALQSIICNLENKIENGIENACEMIEYFLNNLGIEFDYLRFDENNTIDV